jgi:hypothetical protein
MTFSTKTQPKMVSAAKTPENNLLAGKHVGTVF